MIDNMCRTGLELSRSQERSPGENDQIFAPTYVVSSAQTPLATRFVRVIDGSTIEVQPIDDKSQPTGAPNFTVHMLGTAAPAPTECGGAESIANLKRLFRPNELVKVTAEPLLTTTKDKDGNTLAYVITGAGVTQDIGLRMVKEGFAAASYPQGQREPAVFAQYTSYAKGAVDQKDGIWANCPAPKA
ncbi:thermonuclease family protein [Pseudarthrobacter sp. J1738]|uniref:thermonuclease family protein n=1 Tax=Pseudarthrobacter sp. J1738 TaxID=3420446 RepID=UPI003D27F659